MIWIVGLLAFAAGTAIGYAISVPHHRSQLREVEDRYTRITESRRPRPGSTAVPPGVGNSRVTTGKMKHKRGSVQR